MNRFVWVVLSGIVLVIGITVAFMPLHGLPLQIAGGAAAAPDRL